MATDKLISSADETAADRDVHEWLGFVQTAIK